MFFSKVLLIAIFLGANSVLATPHPLHHHLLHRRGIAARVAAAQQAASNNTTAARQRSDKCSPHSSSSNIPSVELIQPTPVVSSQPSSRPPPTPSPSPTFSPPKPSPPASTPQQQPPTSTSTAGGPIYTGQLTWFATGLGACGITNLPSDLICAIPEAMFDTYPGYDGVNPNTNPVCGKKIQIDYQGKSITVTVTDRCTGCDSNSLDLTTGAFGMLADLGAGRLYHDTWRFL